jgi:hypothetical protein
MNRLLLLGIGALLVFSPRPAPSQPSAIPLVFVRSVVQGDQLQVLSAKVVTSVVPPRFNSRGPLEVLSLDSDDQTLAAYRRGDIRVAIGEGTGSGPRPDGHPVLVSVEVVAALRRVQVRGPADEIVLDLDLGPTVVDACASGALATGLCETFDSDGDGCRDAVDPEPLTPESEPPALSVAASPESLWPANHQLVDVAIQIEVSDNCDPAPVVTLISATSSDPESGVTPADVPPNKAPDIAGADIGTSDDVVQLRAERWPQLAVPRIYTLTYRAVDRAGNEAVATALVTVPRSRP